jgi:hypothetical protein
MEVKMAQSELKKLYYAIAKEASISTNAMEEELNGMIKTKPMRRNKTTIQQMATILSTIRTAMDKEKSMKDMTIVDVGCTAGMFIQAASKAYDCKVVGVDTSAMAVFYTMRSFKLLERPRAYVAAVPSILDITSMDGADIIYCSSLGYELELSVHLIQLAVRSPTVKMLIMCPSRMITGGGVFWTHIEKKAGLLFITIDKNFNLATLPPYERCNKSPAVNPVAEANDVLESMTMDEYAITIQMQFRSEKLLPSFASRGGAIMWEDNEDISVPVSRARQFYLREEGQENLFDYYIPSLPKHTSIELLSNASSQTEDDTDDEVFSPEEQSVEAEEKSEEVVPAVVEENKTPAVQNEENIPVQPSTLVDDDEIYEIREPSVSHKRQREPAHEKEYDYYADVKRFEAYMGDNGVEFPLDLDEAACSIWADWIMHPISV